MIVKYVQSRVKLWGLLEHIPKYTPVLKSGESASTSTAACILADFATFINLSAAEFNGIWTFRMVDEFFLQGNDIGIPRL